MENKERSPFLEIGAILPCLSSCAKLPEVLSIEVLSSPLLVGSCEGCHSSNFTAKLLRWLSQPFSLPRNISIDGCKIKVTSRISYSNRGQIICAFFFFGQVIRNRSFFSLVAFYRLHVGSQLHVGMAVAVKTEQRFVWAALNANAAVRAGRRICESSKAATLFGNEG